MITTCLLLAAPILTVRVYDYAGLSSKMLSDAMTEAEKLYRKAGLETEWLLCPIDPSPDPVYAACKKPIGAADLSVRIVPQAMEGYPVPEWAFGFALPAGDAKPAAYAYVFHHRVEQAAREAQVAAFRLLGCVMAHEAGHLLLGLGEHARRGLMCARWVKAELRQVETGALVFTREQAGQLRSRAAARLKRE